MAESGDFEPADLVEVVGVVASAVPEWDVPPGQLPDLGVQDEQGEALRDTDMRED
ncbi:hypothetical protein [Streptomyces sp. CBMA29]|uniref:hypothetical protein n=1 Tax=Streptomyces sp. CBMA29 TaxID=1896314 RepID=UPI001661CCFE|nr:hypothetical protein [Streptomyces sp. CBMA29]